MATKKRNASEQTKLQRTGLEPEPEKVTNPADELETGQSVAALPDAEETAAKAADTVEPSHEFRKVFVLGPGDYTKANGFDHEPNLGATRQYAIAAGLWPTGDARYVSTATHDDGVSKVLTYAVPVKPTHEVAPESPHPEVRDGDGDVAGAENADASKTVEA